MNTSLNAKSSSNPAQASWSAPVLWRFQTSPGPRKAPEGWSTPKRCRALVSAIALWSALPLFATAPSYETEREFTASGDFNGDGNIDVLIVDKVTGLYRIGEQP